jgi:hypothetical protein
VQGVERGRDATREKLKSSKGQIAELQERVVELENERRMRRALLRNDLEALSQGAEERVGDGKRLGSCFHASAVATTTAGLAEHMGLKMVAWRVRRVVSISLFVFFFLRSQCFPLSSYLIPKHRMQYRDGCNIPGPRSKADPKF